MRWAIRGLLASLAMAAASGCAGNSVLPPGEYSGSTPDNQSVVVDVGATVQLDGVELRHAPDNWFRGVHDKSVRMRCHTANHRTELACTIVRHGRTETDELLKL